MKKKGQQGEITVFLALVLTILISLLFTVIEAARTNGIQFQTECVADMAIQSVLAEYNRQLLEQYDLLFQEIGYGTDEGGYILLEEHIRDYMEENFRADTGGLLSRGEARDLLQLSVQSAAILQAAGAADGQGAVLERSAVEYMLDRYGMQDLSELVNRSKQAEEKGLMGNQMEKRRERNERDISKVDTTVESKNGKKKKLPIQNPADEVNSKRGSMGILSLVTEKKGVSQKSARLNSCISHREYIERDGFLQGEQEAAGWEDLIFQKYLMEKCGNYTQTKDDSALDYELEYILTGKAADQDNLKAVVGKLLLLRETANFAYLLSDTAKQAEAEALAMTLAVVTLFPELTELIKLSILIAWSYAESVNDMRILLEGGKVPLWKDVGSWQLSLENAMQLKLKETGDSRSGQGLDYAAYLHLLLAVMDKKERNLRFMDVVEMDIRRTPGNEAFSLDHCLHGFTAEIMTVSARGHYCMLTRTAGYEK